MNDFLKVFVLHHIVIHLHSDIFNYLSEEALQRVAFQANPQL